MSSRARRVLTSATVVPFAWGNLPGQAGTEPDAAREAGATAAEEQADHQATLAALERDAFMKGFAQGERAGNEAAAQRGEAMLRRLTETLQELTVTRAQMIRQTERQMVQLALAVARRVVHREVSLDRLGENMAVTIRLHPADFEATAAGRTAHLDGGDVSVVADPRIGRGGCRVESEFGTMEAGIDAQIQELALALLGAADTAEAAGA